MTEKKRAVRIDTIVKSFMQQYSIPTKKDIDELMNKLDDLEKLVKNLMAATVRNRRFAEQGMVGRYAEMPSSLSASAAVLEVIKDAGTGIGFKEIKARTGFDEKKLRNIIYRLDKLGKIVRESRGLYVAK